LRQLLFGHPDVHRPSTRPSGLLQFERDHKCSARRVLCVQAYEAPGRSRPVHCTTAVPALCHHRVQLHIAGSHEASTAVQMHGSTLRAGHVLMMSGTREQPLTCLGLAQERTRRMAAADQLPVVAGPGRSSPSASVGQSNRRCEPPTGIGSAPIALVSLLTAVTPTAAINGAGRCPMGGAIHRRPSPRNVRPPSPAGGTVTL
jgi:hypothetical protein